MNAVPCLLAVMALLLASCVNQAEWSERAARNQLMLVKERPPTLGFRRLHIQAAAHPDLAAFLNMRGRPDFIAETSSDDRQYMILYYLQAKRAFACRSWRGQGGDMDFAGPYPITDREVEVLESVKRGAGNRTLGQIPRRRMGSQKSNPV